MRKQYFVPITVAILVMLLAMVAASCAAQQTPAPPQPTGPITIKVGVESPLSGPASPWGKASEPGHAAFLKLFNQDGGFTVNGQQYFVEEESLDDQGSSEGGIAAAKQLIADGCRFIVGHWTWNFPAVQSVTNPAKVIFITRTGSEAVPMTYGGVYNPQTMPYVVFGSPNQEVFTKDIGALIKAFPNYKKIGFLLSTAGQGGGRTMVEEWAKQNNIKWSLEIYTQGTKDYTPVITRLNEDGCDIAYIADDIGAALAIGKQRWDLGYHDMRVGHAGPFVDVNIYLNVVGKDAAQGFIADYAAPFGLKETKVNPKYVDLMQRCQTQASADTGKPYRYTGWMNVFPQHVLILTQAMEKAGTTTDPDAIMKAIRGGTFDTPSGKYTMSGAKTYGSPVVCGNAGALCQIQGDQEVLLSESPWENLP
jgi:ABC-type branched-subunit amino acid transport system substrate-binding protein